MGSVIPPLPYPITRNPNRGVMGVPVSGLEFPRSLRVRISLAERYWYITGKEISLISGISVHQWWVLGFLFPVACRRPAVVGEPLAYGECLLKCLLRASPWRW